MRTPNQPRRVLPNSCKLVDHSGHDIRRHGKPDPDRTAGGRQDRGVHADHLTIHVEQRTARIAAVDGGVGLDVIVVIALQRATAGRNDPGADRKALPQRVADRQTQSPTRDSGIAPDMRQIFVMIDLQQRDIGGRVGPTISASSVRPEKNSIVISSAPSMT